MNRYPYRPSAHQLAVQGSVQNETKNDDSRQHYVAHKGAIHYDSFCWRHGHIPHICHQAYTDSGYHLQEIIIRI
jgi:hypothetical protein